MVESLPVTSCNHPLVIQTKMGPEADGLCLKDIPCNDGGDVGDGAVSYLASGEAN